MVKVDEEYATELTDPMVTSSVSGSTANIRPSRTWGWCSLVVAILSLFSMPVMFGTAGAVLGIIAFFKGNRTQGGWAIAISLISIIATLALVPYYA